MKGRDRRTCWLLFVFSRLPPWKQFRDPFFHLARSFVREGHSQDLVGSNAALDHVRDAKSDHARLARPRAGENEHRAADGLDGQPLLWIECAQVDHRARSLSARKPDAKMKAKKVIRREKSLDLSRVSSGLRRGTAPHL